MDIEGAKVLKRRLGLNAADAAPPLPQDVPADAPPLYHWVGVGQVDAEAVSSAADGDAPGRGASLLRWLGLSSR